METTEHGPSRRGRGEKFPGGREAILEAARAQFAALGYARATIRGIAAEAGVDPKLVMHFYSSKDELFGAALALPAAARGRVLEALQGPADRVPRNLIRTYVELWEDPSTSATFRATLLSISTSEEAKQRLHEMLDGGMVEYSGAYRPEVLTIAMSQLLGAAIARYVLQVPHLASLSAEEFAAALLPSVEAALRG